MNNISFPYYTGNIFNSKFQDEITLNDFIDLHTCNENAKIFEDIYNCKINGDEVGRKKLKESLMHFTPVVKVKERRVLTDIVEFTGLAQLDFDHLDNIEYAESFKNHLFNEFKQIVCCYFSPSKGVKALIKIPICKNIEEFREYYYGIIYVMQRYKGFDTAPKNAVLPLFQSYDNELLCRDFNEAKEWTIKGVKKEYKSTDIKKPINIDKSDYKINYIYKKIEKMFNNIIDNGHPQVVSTSMVIGGYVGAGYISYNDAVDFVKNCISCNSYLQKGLTGYKKTAVEFINYGISKPIYL